MKTLIKPLLYFSLAFFVSASWFHLNAHTPAPTSTDTEVKWSNAIVDELKGTGATRIKVYLRKGNTNVQSEFISAGTSVSGPSNATNVLVLFDGPGVNFGRNFTLTPQGSAREIIYASEGNEPVYLRRINTNQMKFELESSMPEAIDSSDPGDTDDPGFDSPLLPPHDRAW